VSDPRYRLDFIVPAGYDIAETEAARSPLLESVRSALIVAGWGGSMAAPWRPSTDETTQHLIVWVNFGEPIHEATLGVRVASVVGDVLPGVRLERVELQPE
jgi:hypothetical protein